MLRPQEPQRQHLEERDLRDGAPLIKRDKHQTADWQVMGTVQWSGIIEGGRTFHVKFLYLSVFGSVKDCLHEAITSLTASKLKQHLLQSIFSFQLRTPLVASHRQPRKSHHCLILKLASGSSSLLNSTSKSSWSSFESWICWALDSLVRHLWTSQWFQMSWKWITTWMTQ